VHPLADRKRANDCRQRKPAAVHGYSAAYWWAAGILVVGAVICGLLLRPGAQAELDPNAAPVVAH
jgi:hypothetical protein